MENKDLSEQTNEQKFAQKKVLPNATAILVLGICSLALCWCCYGFFLAALILSIIALVLANKAKVLYDQNPELYTESSFKNMKAGRTCAIIGLCISGAVLLIMIIYILIAGIALGTFLSTMPWEWEQLGY